MLSLYRRQYALSLSNRLYRSFSAKKQDEKSPAAIAEKYLMFPTRIPIFPNFTYLTKINKILLEVIKKHRIKYVVALPLQQGEEATQFYPSSIESLEQQLGLTQEPKKQTTEVEEAISVAYPIYDGLVFDTEDRPVSKITNLKQVYPVGSLCRIFFHNLIENDQTACMRADLRFKINAQQFANAQNQFMVSGKIIKVDYSVDDAGKFKNVLSLFTKIKENTNINLPHIGMNQNFNIKNMELLSGFLCTTSVFRRSEMYALFETVNVIARLDLLTEYYEKYTKALTIEWEQLQKKHKYPLDEEKEKQKINEIYEYIKKILNRGGSSEFVDKINKLLRTRTFPPDVLEIIQEELKNISDLGEGHPEFQRKKHFLLTITSYPYGVRSVDTHDIQQAEKILDEDHYGMAEVKKRILEFIASAKLKGSFKSKVLLLHGPPGVGKTSIVKSIAKCLGRKYARISLGGEYDPNLIRGHRKTYVGAYPGKIFESIRQCKTENPVILLDEIDKIQSHYSGSLQDVVMEVLDPVQNKKFRDQFIDAQIDLSNVLFICTANSLQSIFPPLLDRLERVEVNGYTTQEKKMIFKNYLVKNAIENTGLNSLAEKIHFSDEAIVNLIDGYCREAGVRSLDQLTTKICQKIALNYVQKKPVPEVIGVPEIKKYAGLPRFTENRMYPGIPPAGVIIGLAYTGMGGCTLYIQTAKSCNSGRDNQGKRVGSLLITGNLQDVMKESCQLAYSYAKYILFTFFNNNYLERYDVHLNFPEIQIGKDGPSAGIAITSALISLALDKPTTHVVAMTGEISLSGNVMAIGGVKEKTLGAKREGIRRLIFPADNQKNVKELEAEVKEGMEFKFVSHYFEVIEELFGIKLEEPVAEVAVKDAPTIKEYAQA